MPDATIIEDEPFIFYHAHVDDSAPRDWSPHWEKRIKKLAALCALGHANQAFSTDISVAEILETQPLLRRNPGERRRLEPAFAEMFDFAHRPKLDEILRTEPIYIEALPTCKQFDGALVNIQNGRLYTPKGIGSYVSAYGARTSVDGPIDGVIAIRRTATVACKNAAEECTYEVELAVLHVAERARGQLVGAALSAAAALTIECDIETLMRSLAQAKWKGRLRSRLRAEIEHEGEGRVCCAMQDAINLNVDMFRDILADEYMPCRFTTERCQSDWGY